jgi:hypothetical protein
MAVKAVNLGAYEIELFGRGTLKQTAIYVSFLAFLSILYAVYSDYNLATGTGNLTMVLFLAANVYFPAKRIRIWFKVDNVQQYFNTLLVYHIWLNTAAFIGSCIHCYVTLWSNTWLIVSLFIMGWLTFGGFLMFIKFKPGKVKRGMYLLHTQHFLFIVLLFTVLKGHYVI